MKSGMTMSTDSKVWCSGGDNNHYGYNGDIMGINSNTTAHINCSHCLEKSSPAITQWEGIAYKEDTGLKEDHYTGYKFQCVEYARRWLINNMKCTFGDINHAAHIFEKISHVNDLINESKKLFQGFKNSNENFPKYGDLIIFPKFYGQPWGHVGVITGVNPDKGYYEISEQNNENYWEDPTSYARRLVMLYYEKQYTLTEIPWNENIIENIKNKGLEKEIASEGKSKITGWKRIQE